MTLYTDSDMVKVKNEAGEVLPDPIPKAWLGTYLGEGLTKAKGKDASASSSSTGDTGNTPPAPPADGEPAKSASTEAWVEFAKSKGAADADLVDADGNALNRAALIEKYAAPAE